MSLTFGTRFEYTEVDRIGLLEDWGYDSLWTSEHILFHGPIMEALTQLAFYAARTKRLRLGTAVYLLPLRHPTVVAKTVTTLDILSGGRLTLGIGVGGEFPKEFEATGVPVNERGSRTNESIEVMRRLWTESNVTHQGRHYQFTDVTMEPRPLQQPHPPIVVAGRSDAAQRRAGRLGNGYMPYLYSVDRFAKGVAGVRAAARDAGRDLDAEPFSWMVFLFTALAKTKEEGRRIAAEQLQSTYKQPFEQLVDRLTANGTAADCAERMVEYVNAGARDLILIPLTSRPEERLAHIEAFARDIIPQVRAAAPA